MIGVIESNAIIAMGTSDGPPPRQSAAGGLEGARASGKLRILVVEDEYFVALTIESGLADAGYDVVAVVTSGEDAITEAARSRPELALMDIRLAGELDGVETALELRRLGVSVIFASAHSDDAMKKRGDEARPLGWLAKPFSQEQLLQAVRKALSTLQQN